jgi:PAS domain S-box-containing protein
VRSREELELVAAIADDLACGVWVATAPEGRFVYSNRAFEEIMGMGPEPDAIAGQYAVPYGIFTRGGEQYPESKLPFVQALQARALVVVDDIVIHRRDGRRVFVRAFGKPMVDAQGTITHIAIAFFDITREVEAEKAREEGLVRELEARRQTEGAKVQLAQAERLASVGLLAAGVAHEVNNPMSYVLGSLELAMGDVESLEGSAPADVLQRLRELLTDAREGSERVRDIVRDLKLFSRVDQERPRSLDVRVPLRASIGMARNEIRHRAKLVESLEAVPPVHADDGRLGQLFLNLLINAVHAIPEGASAKNEIRVSTRYENDRVVVEISDTGVGIEETSLPRIFEPFFTTKPAGVGTGLGLSICHAIVNDIGGDISVTSSRGDTPHPGERGRGTTFRVELPVARRPTIDPGKPNEASLGVRRGSVLIVDDEPLLLKMLASVLSAEHDVTCEARAESALERVRRGERFDAIVCDLMMPQMTGMELHAALVALAPEQAKVMIFMTGGAFTPKARAFVDELGSVGALEKPLDARTLLTRVRAVVG